MSRTYVITGSASGIGAATSTLLADRGDRVIGIDLADADVCADLATPAGRSRLADDVHAASGGHVDAVLAVAGVSAATPLSVAVNYFGAVATLETLRPLLCDSSAPRAVAVTSMVAVHDVDDPLVAMLLAGAEDRALDRAASLAGSPDTAGLIYAASKNALARWVRRASVTPSWAGHGIALNAIAPGVMLTPMSAPRRDDPAGRRRLAERVPMPLNGHAPAEAAAHLLAWLACAENTHLAGQIIFLDGGAEATVRGDTAW